MLYLINSFAPDTESLHICVNRVKSLDKNAIVVVLNDGNNPVKKMPRGVLNVVTGYNRGGNLRGTECVHGQLLSMQKVLELNENEKFLVKLDCDTWLNSIDWLSIGTWAGEFDGEEPDLIVQERSDPYSISGDCYRLSRNAVASCLQALEKRIKEANVHGVENEDLPEDVTICHLCSFGGLRCKHIPYYFNNHVGMHEWLPTERELNADVVHCGEGTYEGRRATRDFVLLRMRVLEAAVLQKEKETSQLTTLE